MTDESVGHPARQRIADIQARKRDNNTSISEKLDEIELRLIRIETRLCKLAAELDVSIY